MNLKRNNKKWVISLVFNLISYVLDPISSLNSIVSEGDIIIISTWSDNDKAKQTRENYLHHIEKKFPNNASLCQRNFIDLEKIAMDKIQFYKYHKIHRGCYTDSLIIYL